jgi:hypothetical protein
MAKLGCLFSFTFSFFVVAPYLAFIIKGQLTYAKRQNAPLVIYLPSISEEKEAEKKHKLRCRERDKEVGKKHKTNEKVDVKDTFSTFGDLILKSWLGYTFMQFI